METKVGAIVRILRDTGMTEARASDYARRILAELERFDGDVVDLPEQAPFRAVA